MSTSDESNTLIVNCSETIRILELEIDDMIKNTRKLLKFEGLTPDEILLSSVWGLDCEWLPGIECGKDNPVAILQLSTTTHSFLVDLQSLCQSLHHKGAHDTSVITDIEALSSYQVDIHWTISECDIKIYNLKFKLEYTDMHTGSCNEVRQEY